MARGRIKDEDIETLRERGNIVDVVSDYVQLKKAGKLYKGLCPFHDEKTPSFMVDPTKQLYHCFGCGEGGNVYTFLMKKEGLDFREAVERLASRIGYNLRYEGVSREAREAESGRKRLYRLNRWAADVYHEMLLRHESAEGARRYLKSRGLGKEAVEEFTLGFAPHQWDFLYRRAVHEGFAAADFINAGLGLRGERGTYDRFRSRLIFPIQDLQDRVIAFGGRVIGDDKPKYLNSPETLIYVKSRHLYALNLSRREIVGKGFAVLVEGYTDVIGLWQAGIRNVAATLGTALGEEHFRLLSRLTEKVILAFDADAAGTSAAERGLDYYGDFDLDLRVVVLEEGSDPADFVAREGAERFLERLESSLPLVDFCLEKALAEHDPSDSNSRLRGVRRAVKLVGDLGSEIDHERYIKEIADWAGSGYERIYELYRRARGKTAERIEVPGSPLELLPHVRAERELLRLLLHHPYILEQARLDLDVGLIEDDTDRLLLEALLETDIAARGEASGEEAPFSQLIQGLDTEQARNLATALLFDKSGNVDNINSENAEMIYRDLLVALKGFYFERQIRKRKKDLERISSSTQRDHVREGELTEEIYALERMRRELRQGS